MMGMNRCRSSKTPSFRSFTVACAAVVLCRVQLMCRADHVCYWRWYFTGDTMEQPGSSHHIRWQELTNRLESLGNSARTRPKPVRLDSLSHVTANNLTVGFYIILHEIWWRGNDFVRKNPRMHKGGQIDSAGCVFWILSIKVFNYFYIPWKILFLTPINDFSHISWS